MWSGTLLLTLLKGKMNIPLENFSIKVGPFTYEVIYSDDVPNEGNAFGCTHSDHQKIFIHTKYPRQKQVQTFIHELLHAVTFVSGLVYRFDKKEVDAKPTEEDVVREMSIVLYQVLNDNPEIFK